MVATRFAVAAHIMLYLAAPPSTSPRTSLRLAASVNTNPVVVRRITGHLARAGLIHIRRGPGGADLTRPAEAITLEDVWRAVNETSPPQLLAIHSNPNPECPVGGAVTGVLSTAFGGAEAALHAELARTTVADLRRMLPGAASVSAE